MKKTLRIRFFAIIALAAFGFGVSNAQIRITEVMSQSVPKDSLGGTEDWFELTNLGTAGVDITDWKMFDKSNPTKAVALNGVTTIASGESVIFLEASSEANAATEIAAFKAFWWGASANATQVGHFTGVGLKAAGESVYIYNELGGEVTYVDFGVATTGSTFYWTYDALFNVVRNGTVSTEGTILGTIANQVTITSDNSWGNIGSPGTAVIGDVVDSNPTSLADDIKSWNLIGKSLQFKQVPVQAIEIYSLTGSKVATHAPASLIELDLNQGIYILKIDGKAHKVIVR